MILLFEELIAYLMLIFNKIHLALGESAAYYTISLKINIPYLKEIAIDRVLIRLAVLSKCMLTRNYLDL